MFPGLQSLTQVIFSLRDSQACHGHSDWLARECPEHSHEFFAALGVWNLGKSGFSGPMNESCQAVAGSFTVFKPLFVFCQRQDAPVYVELQ